MQHIHLKTCESTQKYLIDNIQHDSQDYLVTCDQQISGIGQRNNTWTQYLNTVCFSFTITPHEVLTLSSLEIGVLIVEYFQKFNCDLKLKWPNDLMTSSHKKCGGILINSNSDKLVVGIGLNLFLEENENNNSENVGQVFKEKTTLTNLEIIFELINYIKTHRLTTKQIINKFDQNCCHKNQRVEIAGIIGIFEGISHYGEAIVSGKKYVSGPLKI